MESEQRPTVEEKLGFEVGQQKSFYSRPPHLSGASCRNPGIPHPLIITMSHMHARTHMHTSVSITLTVIT